MYNFYYQLYYLKNKNDKNDIYDYDDISRFAYYIFIYQRF